jgi:hypothetical protein
MHIQKNQLKEALENYIKAVDANKMILHLVSLKAGKTLV